MLHPLRGPALLPANPASNKYLITIHTIAKDCVDVVAKKERALSELRRVCLHTQTLGSLRPREAIIFTREGAANISCIIVEDDLIHRSLHLIRITAWTQAAATYICPCTQEVEAHDNDEDIHYGSDPAPPAANFVEVGAVVHSPHPKVSNAPEDPAEEGIE